MVQDRKLLLTGAAGLAGATLLLVGDFLLYAHPANLPVVAPAISDALGPRQAILLASPAQLTISSIIGPLAAIVWRSTWRTGAATELGTPSG